MEERQITSMEPPILYPSPSNSATDAIEYEGTFPLPEAQLDRFLMRLELDLNLLEDEVDLDRQQYKHPISSRCSRWSLLKELDKLKKKSRRFMWPAIKKYMVEIVARQGSILMYILGPVRGGRPGAIPQRRSCSDVRT